MSQRLIPTDERSGLLTRIAATGLGREKGESAEWGDALAAAVKLVGANRGRGC